VKKNLPKDAKQPGGGSKSTHSRKENTGQDLVTDHCVSLVVTDPEDPKFDLEAYLTMTAAGQDPKSA